MNPDLAYANADFIPNATKFPPLWEQLAQEFRAGAKNLRTDLRYGTGLRQVLDLVLPDDVPRGLVVFVHGGYWRAFNHATWTHLAAGPLAHGWAVALPSYTLAPEARISEITREVARAIDLAAEEVAGPVVLTGHSAGGHLVARMNCADVTLACAGRIRRIVPISPLSDLRPLLHTALNADLRLDAAEAAAESPALVADRRSIPTLVWAGAQERPVFLDQARWMAEAWPEARLRVAPGRHHFDIIDPLVEPESALVTDLLA